MGKFGNRPSPSRRAAVWRPNSSRKNGVMGVTSFALTRATKALSTVQSSDASTQRGNIKVVVRVRPPNCRENTANSRVVVYTVDSHMVVFDPPDDQIPDFYFKGVKQNYLQKQRHKNTKLAFDNVYGPSSTNDEIFQDVINPMLDTLLNGFNCSVFAYGATGSGKTHTMIGSMDNHGLTYKTVMELYTRLENMAKDYETEVSVSYLEVYNEAIRDLLQTSSGDLQIREDNNGVVVANLTTHKPKDSYELLDLLSKGNSVRSQHPTDHNAESSRSHAVFMVYIKLRSRFTELTNTYKSAKLVMVDLAGSEKGAATGFQGQRFREGASINKSLLSLGNCINALADGKKHIPYRDSKLTRILKDSLGGNCKTVMIANVSPSSLSYDDSYNTLRYADRAKRIKFQVKKNAMTVSACLTQYTKVVEEMSHKIEQLERELSEYKSTCKCNITKEDACTETCSLLSPPVIVPPPVPETIYVREERDPIIPKAVMSNIEILTRKRQKAIKFFGDCTVESALTTTKIAVKEQRIITIRKIKSTTAATANIAKTEKQLEPLYIRRKEVFAKRVKAENLIKELDVQGKSLEEQYAEFGDMEVPMKISDYFQFQNLKVDQERTTSSTRKLHSIGSYFMDEWKKGESLLGSALEMLSSQYILSKHYKNNTKQMDADFDQLVSNVCGTKVQWSKDMCSSGSSVPNLKRVFDYEANDENEDDDTENFASPANHYQPTITSIRSRLPTPPRLPKFEIDDSVNLSVTDELLHPNETFNVEPATLKALVTNVVNEKMNESNGNGFMNRDVTFATNPGCYNPNETVTLEHPLYKGLH